MISVRLPWPPSVNNYYRACVRNGKPRQIKTPQARSYRDHVRVACLMAGINGRRLSGRLAVDLKLCPPTRRSFDLDNRCKGVLDGLTYAGVWEDDSQVDRLTVTRGERISGGFVEVQIFSENEKAIADHVGVSAEMVRKRREELPTVGSSPQPTHKIGADGKEYPTTYKPRTKPEPKQED